MAWYERSGPGADVFVSTRVRVARNINGYPFEERLTADMAKEIGERTAALFPKEEGYQLTDMQSLSAAQAMSLCEKHYISREFAQKSSPHLLITDDNRGLSIMVCEEDHLRIQCLATGLSLDECFRFAYEAEEKIADALDLAFDEKLGYLTHCPTNLGTGMRVSVMMFLPALTKSGKMRSLSAQLQKVGLVIRGMQGEGSDTAGYLYQVSNQVTLGISEEETVRKVGDMVRRIAATERAERKAFEPSVRLKLADRACRAKGLLSCAKMLSTEEFFVLWADLRLGICLGEFPDWEPDALDKMIFEVMPATVSLSLPKESASLPDSVRRDLARADAVHGMMNMK